MSIKYCHLPPNHVSAHVFDGNHRIAYRCGATLSVTDRRATRPAERVASRRDARTCKGPKNCACHDPSEITGSGTCPECDCRITVLK